MLRSVLSPTRCRADGAAQSTPADLLLEARAQELAGCIPEATQRYGEAIAAAERCGEHRTLAESLRRLAVLRYHGNETSAAQDLCARSYEVAADAGNDLLAAEALNTLATLRLQTGSLSEARSIYEQALALGGEQRTLRAAVEQNLGIVANIHGDLDAALHHYRSSLQAYDEAGDQHGCARAYHNLGMVSADRGLWSEAQEYFDRSRAIAERSGDAHLKGLCLLNGAEVLIARQQYEEARGEAEAALALFDQLCARAAKADAYRVIGTIYRETGRYALAESRLRFALDLATQCASVLGEAEAARELAVLYQATGRNQEALRSLNRAYERFTQLDARVDLINVGRKVEDLEATYLAVVQEWGQSIESSDSYTHGHCERVATYAVKVAEALDLPPEDRKTIQIGAYLHDLGKIRVPHEVLNKPGPLTPLEFELMQMHTVWGVEALDAVEFPWDIRPIIRWHHEKVDGSGYPDRLAGDEIPLSAQVIGIVDVYDALTTTRAYRSAMPPCDALAVIQQNRHWWRADVVEAFLRAVPEATAAGARAA
ncbi:MAG TPA: tetratricopeptide repeat protein [Gemmatimonadales bacterium]